MAARRLRRLFAQEVKAYDGIMRSQYQANPKTCRAFAIIARQRRAVRDDERTMVAAKEHQTSAPSEAAYLPLKPPSTLIEIGPNDIIATQQRMYAQRSNILVLADSRNQPLASPSRKI